MKRVVVLAVGLVLLVLIVGSVSANVIQNPPIYPDSASDGEYHPDDQYSLNKLAPIIISNKRAAVINAVDIKPPTTPCAASGTVKPLGGGSTITIIVSTKARGDHRRVTDRF